MKLLNRSNRRVFHEEDHKGHSAHCLPQKIFEVSDALGRKLKKLFPDELQSMDDMMAGFQQDAPKASAPAAQEAPKANAEEPVELTDAEKAEKEEADLLGISVDELRASKTSE